MTMHNGATYDAAVAFYLEHAGFSYDPARETEQEGRLRTARTLAAADLWREESDAEVRWAPDWEVTNHVKEYDGYDREPETCETATLLDRRGDVLDSLCCIDDASDNYRRVVTAELSANVMSEPVQCGTCGRMFPNIFPAARCPFEYDHEDEDEDGFTLYDPEEVRTILADLLDALDRLNRIDVNQWAYQLPDQPYGRVHETIQQIVTETYGAETARRVLSTWAMTCEVNAALDELPTD